MMAEPMAKTREAAGDVSAILLDQADRLFQLHAGKDVLTAADGGAWPEPLWRAVEEAGLPLALVPEEAGGVGLGMPDVARLLRRSAYHTVPLPLAETVIGAALWAAAGGAAVEGAIALAPTNSADRVEIAPSDEGYVLSGVARRVPWGHRAPNRLVFARDDRGRAHLVLVERGKVAASGNKVIRNLAYEPRDTLDFAGVTVARDAVRPAPVTLGEDGLMLHGAFVRAQQMVGGMERCLDYALAYANERVQFGRPIAKFQAVQHMLAVAAGHFAAATAAADAAAESFDAPDFALAVAVAKGRCGEAAAQVAAVCHQVHGAMGFTQEHPLHFASRRLWSWRDEFGGETEWYERLGALVCGRGGEALWPLLVGQEGRV
jgi:acyl-CoA dehydrogenase